LKEAIELAEYLRDLGYMPEQVQDFYPTPSTLSTVMYYTGLDPRDMKPVYVCRNPHEKAMQRALIQYRNPKNYDLVYEALVAADRMDLIGFDKKCLIRPRKLAGERAEYGKTRGGESVGKSGKMQMHGGKNGNGERQNAKGNNKSGAGKITQGKIAKGKTIEGKSAEKKSVAVSDKDFRRKWPANYRCEDGHYVRSKNEQLVDNWLYHHNVCHAYEPLVVDKKTGREYLSDFFIPHIALYIEVWGYETAEYLQRKTSKIEVYQSNHLLLLQLTDEDVKNLDDCLKRNVLAKMT
jgi:hypothetical protein